MGRGLGEGYFAPEEDLEQMQMRKEANARKLRGAKAQPHKKFEI